MKLFDLSIVGEVNLDLILRGLPVVMPLERELLADGMTCTLGGSSAIVAHNAAMLGARVMFVTMIGRDVFGELACDQIRKAGVAVHAIEHPTAPTGITLLLPHGAERRILTYPGTIDRLSFEDFDLELLMQARHVHLSSLFLQKGLHPGLIGALQRLKQAGLTISLDTNDDPDDNWGAPLADVLALIDCFLPNESELCRMTRTSNLKQALASLTASIPLVVVKRGPKGARLRAAGEIVDVPALSLEPVDTIGAGDSFDAGFLRAYLEGFPPLDCARAGNVTGALSTQSAGGVAAFQDEAQRESFLARDPWPRIRAAAGANRKENH